MMLNLVLNFFGAAFGFHGFGTMGLISASWPAGVRCLC